MELATATIESNSKWRYCHLMYAWPLPFLL